VYCACHLIPPSGSGPTFGLDEYEDDDDDELSPVERDAVMCVVAALKHVFAALKLLVKAWDTVSGGEGKWREREGGSRGTPREWFVFGCSLSL
jgi:hypothetical protein